MEIPIPAPVNINEQLINIVIHMIIIGVITQVLVDNFFNVLNTQMFMEVNTVSSMKKKETKNLN
jgi:hypothetical protein